MGTTYTLTATGSTAVRSSDGAFVPWDPQTNAPFDIAGLAGRTWVADGSPAPLPYVAPPEPIQDEISPRQFFMEAAAEGIATPDEALAFMASKTLPVALATPIAQLPADQQFAVKMALYGNSYSRSNPYTGQIGALLGKDDASMDTFWRNASKL